MCVFFQILRRCTVAILGILDKRFSKFSKYTLLIKSLEFSCRILWEELILPYEVTQPCIVNSDFFSLMSLKLGAMYQMSGDNQMFLRSLKR